MNYFLTKTFVIVIFYRDKRLCVAKTHHIKRFV